MRRWLIGRLLGFGPTLLLVLLVVFAVVNLVPAVPLASPEGEDEASYQSAVEEFRRQFGLDRPVFLNLRHLDDDAAIRARVDAIAAEDDPERRRDLFGELVERGRFAIAGLVAVAADGAAPAEARDLALAVLPELVERATGAPPPRGLVPERRPDAADRDRLAGAWTAWAAEHAELVAPSAVGRAVATFAETRFAAYVSNLARLDFGVSMKDDRPVLPTMLRRLGNSILLVTISIVLAWGIAVPIGVWSARARGTRRERLVSIVLFALYSFPSYVAATLLIRFLCVGEPLDWFPVGGVRSIKGYEELTLGGRIVDRLHHLVLPVACVTYASLAVLSRYARDSVLEVLSSDFVRLARAKGLSERAVLFRHALRNGLLPLVTLLGEALPAIFGGAVLVEILFEIPGIGTYVFEAIQDADYNAILASTLVSAVLTLVGILGSDVLYALVDPRVRFGEEA